MKIQPRDYQQNAHDAVIAWWKKTTLSCVVEAATGAGKSIIISMLAETLHGLSGKKILCLAPTGELVTQNAEKFKATDIPYSIYSASISKSLRGTVIFATEGTFKSVAKRLGHEFAGVIVDEAHRITPTVQRIIADMKKGNENLRVCGLSATPYRLGTGLIFARDPNGKSMPESMTRDPYFTQLVYYIGAPELIARGFLTPPIVGAIHAESYDTSSLKTQSDGKFPNAAVERAFEGWGRKTATIVDDVLQQAHGRNGVMWFAATVKHAEEIMASLPPHNSRMIGGTHNTKPADRKKLVADFKAQKFRHLVSVGTMTTGVDFTHADCIAILRATESISLMQQIIGRGLRLHNGKTDCLVLDYGNNIEKHCPDGDIFKPEIKAQYQGSGLSTTNAVCEYCGHENQFSTRPDYVDSPCDAHGYLIDESGERLLKIDGKPMPVHMGRRCTALVVGKHEVSRCDYWWSNKECPDCGHRNDIAARYCSECKCELVDPNEKLQASFRALKKDPTRKQTDEVLQMTVTPTVTSKGAKMVRVEFITPHRTFAVFYLPSHESQYIRTRWALFESFSESGKVAPRTVTYHKGDRGFYNVDNFNAPTDADVLAQNMTKSHGH